MRLRWFVASCIVIILMGLAHFTAANLAPQTEPTDPRGVELIKLMKEYQIHEVKRTMFEITSGFSHFFELAALTMGIGGLVVARGGAPATRPLAIVYAPALAVMLVNSLVHWFIVPHLFLGVSLALCVVSLIPRPALKAAV